MKKLYSMLAMAAVCFSASALDYTEVALNNPSFEETDSTLVYPNLAGWNLEGDGWYNAEGAASNFAAFQTHTKNPTHGNVVFRTASTADVEYAYIWQEVMGLQPGVYVLIFDGQATRSNWTGLYDDTQFSYGFVCDDYGDPDEAGTAEEPGEGISALFTHGQASAGKWFTCGWRHFVVHATHPDLEDETSIKIGFGIPNTSAPISKTQLVMDNFQLRYYDTTDKDAVIAALSEEIKAWASGDPEAEELSARPFYNKNAVNGHEKNIDGFEANFTVDGVQGITGVETDAEFVGNGKTYNLQGIEVADPTQPGLYIRDGKKFIVK